MNNPEVLVLLSSYNGEKYIKEQIDSILTQKNITVKLVHPRRRVHRCNAEHSKRI